MFKSQKLSWYESLVLNVLKVGHIPRHIGFIMDGNRRYAKERNVLTSVGHKHGFNKMAQTFEWCKQVGVNEVTVYAFSIENFKRSEEEVTDLMSLMLDKLTELLNHKDDLHRNGVSIRFFGSLHLCPKDLQTLMAKLVLETQNNNKVHINICIAYSSRQEISDAITKIAGGVGLQSLKVEDISENLFEKCLYTGRCPDPDLIVRTSGEIRLSDFLLWQSSFALLVFVEEMWPKFSFWSFCYAILYYQQQHQNVSIAKADYEKNLKPLKNDFCSSDEILEEFRLKREKRVSEFIAHLENQEYERIDEFVVQ